ncbi:Choline-sulfatase [Thermogutta terrifontis]|uniref:Choline-sulfatase n=1 Tax=Thermogutta terrifontis TaxID=1331910 RepID=A0A286RHY9_9BACT|nr:sulfatase [Thermogutta terrifontis]ASV75567.1 Choline-sulfatase [Thermogutta terrifontis]
MRVPRILCAIGIVSATLGWLSRSVLAEESAQKAKTQRPNILFIMADDHAYQALSCYGYGINQTPNLDRLAKEGMLFRNCFVTNSICGPSRAVILTGKYSHLNGYPTNDGLFDGTQQTVAKLLQKAGYQTAVIGKWHLGSDPTGFDHWEILFGQGPYYNPPMKTPQGRVVHEGYTTDIITDLVLDFLKNKRDPNRPFFLMYHHKAPHRNWCPGPQELDLYKDVTIPEPPTLFDDYATRGRAAHEQEMTIARHLTPHDLKLVPQMEKFTPEQAERFYKAYEAENEAFKQANLQGEDLVRWKYQRYLKDYLRCVAGVDRNVGRVLDYLDQSGLAENTIVIYTSDQGFYLGEHGWFDKRFMYEESLRTPLLVRWPGHTPPGSVCEKMVLNLDFPETFLDVAGVPIPEDMQGRSLKPLLEGKDPPDWRTSIYYRYYEYPGPHMVHKHYGVRTERYKLIYFYEIDEWELYDLQKDPHELHNVYGDPQYADVVRELKAELTRLKTFYKDDDTIRGKPEQKAASKNG